LSEDAERLFKYSAFSRLDTLSKGVTSFFKFVSDATLLFLAVLFCLDLAVKERLAADCPLRSSFLE